MRGAAYGQKFGEGLNQGEDDRLIKKHGSLDILWSRPELLDGRWDFGYLERVEMTIRFWTAQIR